MGLVIALLSVTATTLVAQIKLDPRLAAMRSIWIDAEDELSDAPAVATCFVKSMAATLPLTVAADKASSQVVFKFRPIDRTRVQLGVFLHDDAELWSLSSVVSTPKDACPTAEWLVTSLRDAMRHARDGTWYQPPTGGPASATPPRSDNSERIEELKRIERQLLDSTNPLTAPAPQTVYHILEAAYQITEVNRVFWRFSWKMKIRNYGPEIIVVSPSMEFKNRGGFVVDSDTESLVTIRAQDTVEVTGMALINADIAPTVQSASGGARRIR